MKITISLKHKIIMCLLALLITGLFGMGDVFAETAPVVSVKIKEGESAEKAFTSLEDAWAYATGFDEETLPGTNTKVKSDSRRTNYAEITLYDNCTTTKTLTVPAGVTVRIYMNGKQIAYEGTGSTGTETNPGSVFVVNGERNAPGALFLDGGIFPETSIVTGGKAADKGGGICVNEYGELTLHDVTIKGNVAQNKGGGVFLTSDGTGHGKMTVGGTVTINENRTGDSSQITSVGNHTLQGGKPDDLYISGEDKDPGMDIDGIYNDSSYPLAPDSCINVTHVPNEKIMRDPNREMMCCFKNEKENYVFRYKKFNNTDIEKAGDYIVMVPESSDPPEIKNVTFSTANGEDIESKGQPVIDKTNRTITVTLDTENDLKNLIAEISTTQEVMVRAKDDKPELLPASRQDFELYAGCFAPADYSDPNGRKFILYGFDGDSKNPDNKEWTVKVNATKRTITFDTMGGGALTDSFPDSIVVDKGTRFDKIENPSGGLPKTAGTDFVAFPGRALEGWYFDKTLQRRVTGEEVINNSMTLYAKWYVREFPINYFMTGTPNNQENPAYFNVNSGNLTIKNPQGYENTFNNGKLFIGWSYKDFHNRNVDIGNTLSPQIPSGSFINASTASLDYTPQYMTQQHNVVLDFGGAGEIENKNVMVEHGKSFNANNYIPQDQSLPTGAKWLTDINNHASDCNNQRITTDTTLYAAYALTLNATEGNFSNDSIKGMQRFYAINDDYTSFLSESASIPSRANSDNKRYVFDGWYTADTGGTKVSSGVMPNHNVTLYAHWLEVPENSTAGWQTVRFDTDGVDMPDGAHGISLKQDSTQIDASYFNFDAKPTRNGYTFEGWYAKDIGGNLGETMVWDGNAINTSSSEYTLSLPTYTEGASKDLTLYAKWEQSETQTHTVKFTVNHYLMQADGKTFKNYGGMQTFTINANPVMEVPLLGDDQLKTAFGISDDATLNKVVVMPHDQYVRVDKDVQEVNYYYIRKSFPYFYQYNGTPSGPEGKQFIDTSASTPNGYYPYGANIKIAYTDTGRLLNGSTFTRWAKEIDGVDQNIIDHGKTYTAVMPAGLLSLKPVTTPYSGGTLKINLDGGTLSNTTDQNANPTVKDNQITFTGKSQTLTMPTPTKEGYEFVGWQYNQPGDKPSVTANPLVIDAFTEIDNIKAGKPTTYTAVWKKDVKTLTVDFNLNGHGAPQPKSQTDLSPDSKLPYDCRVVIKNVKATGYNNEDDEVYWYKDSACTQKFDVDNDRVTENMTLYAKWKPQQYNVTLNPNGGSIANGQNSPFPYTIEDNAITLKNPTWPGKTFAGWTGTGLDKPTVNVTIPTGSTGNRTYKANWTTGLYTVNFDTQGKGKAPADQKVLGDDNHLVQRPVNPTEKGYSFEGWFTDKAGTVPYSFNYPLKASQLTNGTLTLYAKWKPILYQLNLDANGGKFKDGSKEKTERRTINENISIIYTDDFTPTRENYLFMGWNTAKETDKGEYFEDKTMPPQNLTLYADWYEIPFVEITFDTQGGTVLPTQFVRSGQKITKPNDPQKTGYVFEGWYTDPEHKARWDFNDPATESMTLHAKWDIKYHTLTLDPNGGSFDDGTQVAKVKQHIHYGADLKDYVEPVSPPPGYKFIGWFSANSQQQTDQQYTDKDKMPDHDVTLVAQYVDDHSIYFDANGGKLSINNPLVEVTTESITPPTTTRTGYTFQGWYLDGAAQPFDFEHITWADGETVKVLKAKWTPKPLTITLKANGDGGHFSDQSSTKTHHAFYDDTAISFGNSPKQSIYDPDNRPTREGYFFVGWYTDPTNEVDTYVDGSKSLTGDITYYAHWTPAPGIVVMFETFGGSTVQPQNLEGGQTATRPSPDPKKLGRDFAGWYQDKECTIEFDFNKPITKNTVVFAKWNTVNYHINADPDGGTISTTKKQGVEITSETVGNKTYTKYQYTYDTPTFSVDNPTKTGYTFTGWEWTITGENNQEIKRKSTTYTVPEGSTINQDIKATWKVNQYNIKYDLDGGTLSQSNKTTYTVETNDIKLNNPTRKGYDFAGWTRTDSSEEPQTPSKSVTIYKGSTGNRAYKANWTPIEYTITYELDGGSLPDGKTNPETYTIEDTIVLNNPTKPGYTFAGWQSSEFSGTMQKAIIPKGSTGDKTYTATWQPITYNISYDLDGGKLTDIDTNPTTYTVESSAITLHNPTKKGYTFTGWTGTDLTEASTSVTISQGSTGDREFKANWTPQKYTLILNPDGGKFADGTSGNKPVTDVEYNTPLYGILPMDLTNNDFKYFCGWKDANGNLYTPNMRMPALENGATSITLTAQWENSKIIYFDINSSDQGQEDKVQRIDAQSGYAKKPANNPTRKHYTFTGWYADPDCTEKFDFNQTITDEFTVIYAGWMPKSYDINYNLDGGDLPDGMDNPDDFTIEDYFTLINPVKTGHTFDGWTGSNGTTADKTVTIDGEDILGNREEDDSFKLEYTANWTINQYTVTFNNMGKGTAPNFIKQAYNSTIQETDALKLSTPGYTFEGWYKDENLTDKWDFATDTIPDHDITLYAKWSADKVAVKVVHQRMNLSGKYDTDESLIETEELKAYSDSLITPATKTYEGFTSPPVQTVSVDPSGNMVVTYQYERNQYILVLNDNENLVDYTTAVSNPTEVNANPIIVLWDILTNAQKTSVNQKTTDTDIYYYGTQLQFNRVGDDDISGGQKWYGWIMENSDGDWLKLSDNQNITMSMPAEDITVEPMVIDGEFTITYDLAGGSLPAGKNNPEKYIYRDDEHLPITLINPTRSGYIFTGWTGGGNAVPTKTVTIKKDDFGDRHYTANWQRIVHTVTFDCNDERIEPIKVSVNDGAKVKEPEVPELDDRVFEYWMTKDGEPYDFNKPVYQNMTLYAKWTDIEPDPEPEKPTPTIYYRGHVQNIGWQTYQGSEWLADTDTVSYIGTTGRALRLEAMEIAVPSGYTVTGFAHIQNRGDTEVEKLPDGITVDGEPYDVYRFGTTGKALRMEAIDFDILKDGKSITAPDGKGPMYRVHIQNGGWQGTVRGGSFAGTRGGSLRLEAMSFSVIR